MNPKRDNIRQGCEGTLTEARAGQGSDWLETIRNLLVLASEANESFDFDRALEYLHSLEDVWNSKGLPELSMELRFQLHQLKGKTLTSLGKLGPAIDEYQKILGFCRDSSHLQTRSETFVQIGQLLCKKGEHDRALGYLQRAIGAYRRLRDDRGTAKALRNLGVVYVELGELDEAEIALGEAIESARKVDDQTLYADLVNNLGAVHNMKGDWELALELYRESLNIYAHANEIRKSAYTKNNIGITLSERGVFGEAQVYFSEAYTIASEINDSSLQLIVDINLADLYVKMGRLDDARHHCDKAEACLAESQLINGHLVEVRKIAGMISRREGDVDSALSHLNGALEMAGELGIQYHQAEVLLERGKLRQSLNQHFEALSDLEASYRIYSSLNADGRRELTEQVIGSIETLYLEVFNSIGAGVDRKDPYTKGHSDRVAALSLLLAKEAGLRGSALKTIVAGALLHDIGKTRIDDAVLNKSGRLTDEEFHHIKKHAEYGVELLRGKEFPWEVEPLILHHHEHFDGGGYPLGLKGEDIPLGARLICIADVFDALTSDRVYRKAFSADKALAIMILEEGETFDPVLLKTFKDLIVSGKADDIINCRTGADEMFKIWAKSSAVEEGSIGSQAACTAV